MTLHPSNTANIWLHELKPTYPGDTLDLNTATVMVTIANRRGDVVLEPESASLVEDLGSFRLVCDLPDTPGWYEAITEVTAGDVTFTITAPFVVEATVGAGS